MEGIVINDENIKKVLKPDSEWYIPRTGQFSKLYKENINQILEAFYYKDITNTLMPEYFGFGRRTQYRKILKSFFNEEYYSKAWKLRGRHMMDTMLKDGTFNLLSKNLIINESGKSILHIKSSRNSIINGTNGFINRSR